MKIFFNLIYYECCWAYQRRGVLIQSALLFSLLLLMWPLLTTPFIARQPTSVVGAMWLVLILLYAGHVEQWFASDNYSGGLTHLLLSPWPLPLLLSIQVIIHWLASLLPLLAILPCVGYLLAMPWHAICTLAASFVLGTFVLSFVGAAMALLVLGVPTGGILIPLLMLPVVVPVLIFGVHQQWGFLLALCALVLGGGPFILSTALRARHIE